MAFHDDLAQNHVWELVATNANGLRYLSNRTIIDWLLNSIVNQDNLTEEVQQLCLEQYISQRISLIRDVIDLHIMGFSWLARSLSFEQIQPQGYGQSMFSGST